jgi:peptidoglycan/LPS O-acetylase OafA/YrhL
MVEREPQRRRPPELEVGETVACSGPVQHRPRGVDRDDARRREAEGDCGCGPTGPSAYVEGARRRMAPVEARGERREVHVDLLVSLPSAGGHREVEPGQKAVESTRSSVQEDALGVAGARLGRVAFQPLEGAFARPHTVNGMASRAPQLDRREPAAISQAGELRSTRIESLRAVAALLVLNGHVFGSAHGYRLREVYGTLRARAVLGGGFGVFLFFALSGYLLYAPFASRDFAKGSSIDLGRYARNRIVRILPLYYVVVAVVLLVQVRFGTFEQWWRFLFFAQSFSSTTVGRVVGPTWSLVVELHFYALLPALAWAIARLARGSASRAALVVVSLGLASLLANELTFHRGLTWRYSLPATFMYFVGGMSLALLRVSTAGRRPSWLRGPLASSTAWLLVAACAWVVVFWNYRLEPLMAVAGFFTVGACVLPLRPTPLFRLLEWRPLAAVGVASYSLYLWHLPIVESLARRSWVPSGYVALLAIAAPLCLAIAAASYFAIEAPFLRFRRRWAPPPATETPMS